MPDQTDARLALVLKDAMDAYYVLPLDLFEHGRVPAERTPALERLLAEAAGESEVQGHSVTGGWFGVPLGPVIAITVRAALLEQQLDQLIQEAGQ
jgi:hypothetical protein